MLVHADRSALERYPIAALAVSGKELQAADGAEAARSLLARRGVKAVPVLDGDRYVGALDRRALAAAWSEDLPVGSLARDLLPVAEAATPAGDALASLDAHGATRLVVLGADGAYLGLVCLRGDRRRLCVDPARVAEHAPPRREAEARA